MDNWKRTIFSPELIAYERKSKDSTVRIECRKDNYGTWKIYKTYLVNSINHTEEFFANSPEERDMLIEQLKNEKGMTMMDIMRLKRKRNKLPRIDMKRAYKDDSVEKWMFSIDNGPYENFFIMYESDSLEVDIVVNSKYSYYSNRIIDAINNILSLDNSDVDVNERIYFFVKSDENSLKSPIDSFIYNMDL